MRECPRCGYEEPPIWRNRLGYLYQQYCHFGDLEIYDPELAKMIKDKGYVFRDNVKYKLYSGGAYVVRIDAKLCADPRPQISSVSEPNKEKHKARVMGKRPLQRKLLEKSFLNGGSFPEKESPTGQAIKEKEA